MGGGHGESLLILIFNIDEFVDDGFPFSRFEGGCVFLSCFFLGLGRLEGGLGVEMEVEDGGMCLGEGSAL